jgi:hypothetical protein
LAFIIVIMIGRIIIIIIIIIIEFSERTGSVRASDARI